MYVICLYANFTIWLLLPSCVPSAALLQPAIGVFELETSDFIKRVQQSIDHQRQRERATERKRKKTHAQTTEGNTATKRKQQTDRDSVRRKAERERERVCYVTECIGFRVGPSVESGAKKIIISGGDAVR